MQAAFTTTKRSLPPTLAKSDSFGRRVAPRVTAKEASASRVTIAHAAEVAPAVAGPDSSLRKYETLIVLKPTLTDEERDQELARFEAFLIKVRCVPVSPDAITSRHTPGKSFL
jgi:hypothetical protein